MPGSISKTNTGNYLAALTHATACNSSKLTRIPWERRWITVVLLLGQRRRRWPNNKTTVVLAGYYLNDRQKPFQVWTQLCFITLSSLCLETTRFSRFVLQSVDYLTVVTCYLSIEWDVDFPVDEEGFSSWWSTYDLETPLPPRCILRQKSTHIQGRFVAPVHSTI